VQRLFLGHVVRDPEYAILMPIRCLSFVRSPVGRLGRNVAHPIGRPGVIEHFDVGVNEAKCMETSANDERVPDGRHENGDCLGRMARPMSRVQRPRRSFGKTLTVLLRLAADGHVPAQARRLEGALLGPS
jgi:hypothetical protein